MGIVVDKILGEVLFHDHPLTLVTSDPSNGKTGQMILNTSDNGIKVFYGNQWQTIYTLTPEQININEGEPMGLLLALTHGTQ